MNEPYIAKLKTACKNRHVTLKKNEDGSITLDGVKCTTISETERYLESCQRKDLT